MKTNKIFIIVFLGAIAVFNSCENCSDCFSSFGEGVCVSPTDTVYISVPNIYLYYDSARIYRSKGFSCDSLVGGAAFTGNYCGHQRRKYGKVPYQWCK